MTRLPSTLLTALALSGLAAAPAAAQEGSHICAEREILTESLAREYSEAPAALGISDTGNVIEVLAANDGRTWTILMTMPDGTSCVLATGQSWEAVPQVAMGQPL